MPNPGSTCSRNSENGASLFHILRKTHLRKAPGLARWTSGKRAVCLSVGESIGDSCFKPQSWQQKWPRELSPPSLPEQGVEWLPGLLLSSHSAWGQGLGEEKGHLGHRLVSPRLPESSSEAHEFHIRSPACSQSTGRNMSLNSSCPDLLSLEHQKSPLSKDWWGP